MGILRCTVLLFFGVLLNAQPQYFELPSYIAPPYPWVKHLYLTYQTHLDVGFTNFAKNVCDVYFFYNYPMVFETLKTLKWLNRTEQMVFTSHPWMILEYLDGTAGCTDIPRTSGQIQEMEDAINQGLLTWHAKPFTMLAEIADAELFEEGVKLSRMLDKRFNKATTITGAHKDVPGISRSVIPILARQGVKAIHIGVNGACLPPALPELFRWRYNGDEILVMLYGGQQGYGYGGNITLADMEVALIYNFTIDNSAPQSLETVMEWWAVLKENYPNAEFHTGSLDDFVNAVFNDPIYSKLQVYEGEMGNTWLYGGGADPLRVSMFREIRRTMMEFEKQHGKVEDIDTILRRLMLIPEHNWGLSNGQYLDQDHYSVYWSNKDFHAHRQDDQYQMLEAGWREKRSFLYTLPQTIKKTASHNKKALALADLLTERLQLMQPKEPNLALYTRLSWSPDQLFNLTFFTFQLDESGAINYLLQKGNKSYLWADNNHVLSKFIYQTFTYSDFHTFNSVYNQRCESYVCGDFAKYNMNNTYSIKADWEPSVQGIFQKEYADRFEFLVQLTLNPATSDIFGAPRMISLTYAFNKNSPEIDINLQWFEKTATRLPEAMWFSFTPIVSNPMLWQMDVMGSPVSPYEVVVNGSRHLHAIWSGISYNDTKNNMSLIIESKDANLVAPGDTAHLLNFDGATQPAVEGGMHFNIFNNLWGTAFNQWYDDDARFRFTLNFRIE